MATSFTPEQKPAARSRLARDFFWIGLLAVVLLILLHQSLFSGKGLVPADAILKWPPWNQAVRPSNALLSDQYYVFLPTHEFTYQQKSFPLWNPTLCCGMPNLASIQGALLFPIQLLLSPLDPFTASGPAAFLKLFLAGWFTMLYLRLLGVSNAGAFLAGMVFSLSGFMIVWLGHPHVNCAMWLPLLLYFMEKSFRMEAAEVMAASSLRAWCGFAVAYACLILGGHPPTILHITVALMIYFIFRLTEHRHDRPWPRVGLLALAIAAGLLLAAPQLLPYFEYYQQSSSPESSVSMARWSYNLNFASLIHFLMPKVMGTPTAGFEDLPITLPYPELHNFNERTGYVGILPLFFAFYAMVARRCKFTKFFLSLAFVSILIIYGVTPFPTLMRALPGFRYMSHMRLLLIVGFSLAVLAGLGWDEFNRTQFAWRRRMVALSFCLAVGVALFCFWHAVGPGLYRLDPAHRAFVRSQFLIPFAGLIVAVFLAWWPLRWSVGLPMSVCLTWTAVDLLFFAMGYNPAIERARYYPKTPAIEWLQRNSKLSRVFGGGAILSPNSAEVFGLDDARGCDYMTVRRYEELINGHAGQFIFYANPTAIPAAFPLLNVKYFLAEREMPVNTNFFDLEYAKEIFIYRFKPCADRALAVFNYEVEPDSSAVRARVTSSRFDPRKLLMLEEQPPPLPAAVAASGETNATGSVQIISYEPDDIKINATFSRPGYLLLLDTYFPGWSATVNGQPAPIYRADYNFRAVALPAGQSSVLFSYRPMSLRIGLYLCAIGILALAGVWFWPVKWNSSNKVP